MAQMNEANHLGYDEIVSEVRALPRDQQQHLRDHLDELLKDQGEGEDELERRLFDAGLLSEIKPPSRSQTMGNFTPITVTGKPVSETIIEERR